MIFRVWSPTQGPPPQEVPEEFAAVYRAAYEQALADFDVSHDRVRTTTTSPTRVCRSCPATATAVHSQAEAGPTWFERLRDTHWFVPLLLAGLVVLLILGAYGIGKAFAAQVDTESPGEPPSVLIGTSNQLSRGAA